MEQEKKIDASLSISLKIQLKNQLLSEANFERRLSTIKKIIIHLKKLVDHNSHYQEKKL